MDGKAPSVSSPRLRNGKGSRTVKRLRLNEEQKADIRRYAQLQYSLDEVAIMMEIDVDKLMASVEADRIYWQSRLKAQAALRAAACKAASEGDAQAQKLVLEWAKVSSI